MKLVAVTACPTGIAHSQMAAENLEQTAKKEGHEITVEIQGAMGAENELSGAEIAAADAVIIAADTSVNRDRFTEVPVVKGTVKDGINDPESLFERARDAAGEENEDGGATEGEREATAGSGAGVEADAGSDAETDTAARSETGDAFDADPAGASAEGETTRAVETGQADVNPDQVGGDPRKGLFARLKRLLS